MKCYIKEITLFNENKEKRFVPLEQGVNIVSGESKTGKSALVEIIDYCLCSSHCTIPKGKITDFCSIVALVLFIENGFWTIGRRLKDGHMSLVELGGNYIPGSLSVNIFSDASFKPFKNVQYDLEKLLNLNVSNFLTDGDEKERVSLRNMVSYMFQHQNLMASKFSLFYRFNNYQKRLDAIAQFPIFAGIINQEYYSTLLLRNELKSELKKLEKQNRINVSSNTFFKNKLLSLLKNYFSLIGQPFDDTISFAAMQKMAHSLPDYDVYKVNLTSDISKRRDELKQSISEQRTLLQDVESQLKTLKKTQDNGNNYSAVLADLKKQTQLASPRSEKYHCPVCGQNCDEICIHDSGIQRADEWLLEELKSTQQYQNDFSEDIRKLEKEKIDLNSLISDLNSELKRITQLYDENEKFNDLQKKIEFAKAEILLSVEFNEKGIFEEKSEEIEELKKRIAELDDKIAQFDVESQMMKAQAFLSENMNRLAQNLDFEEEFRPLNLNFDLVKSTFDLYQLKNSSKTYLYEMGSGANWVSCHVALFLSFLHFFANQKNSPMPLFLFFDQPSQVYFSSKNDEHVSTDNKDLFAVSRMYQTIFDEINLIGSETGFLPQILIVDHANGDNLECKDEFKKHIRQEWTNGNALI